MKSTVLAILAVLAICTIPVSACEKTVNLDGRTWTFHRMPDGNSYHEVQKVGEFTEGDALTLDLPCSGRMIDAIQVHWEDNRSEVQGELVTMPGNKRHGKKDISGKDRESWGVGRKTESFRIEFSGKRGHRARVRWIRVFYGVNAPPYDAKQSLSSTSEDQVELIDRLGLHDGKIQKKARAIRWNGTQFVIVTKTDQGQQRIRLHPNEVKNILFADRWGEAVDKDGGRFPVRAKRYHDGKIELDKNLDGNIVPKPPIDIHHYRSIEFK